MRAVIRIKIYCTDSVLPGVRHYVRKPCILASLSTQTRRELQMNKQSKIVGFMLLVGVVLVLVSALYVTVAPAVASAVGQVNMLFAGEK